ncbi:MAG: hypothetical protein AB7N54_10500 [Alphaproteobacteria bacterium]
MGKPRIWTLAGIARWIVLGSCSLVAACATPQDVLVETEGKAAVIVGLVYDSDHRQNWLNDSIRESYGVTVNVLSLDNLQKKPEIPRYSQETNLSLSHRDTDLVIWVAHLVEPGTLYLASIDEIALIRTALIGFPRRDTNERSFSERIVKNGGEIKSVVVGENTPRFDTMPGEVLYIGTFRSKISSDLFGPFFAWENVTDTMLSYEFQPERAKEIVAASRFARLPMKSVDLFATRPKAREILSAPWAKR